MNELIPRTLGFVILIFQYFVSIYMEQPIAAAICLVGVCLFDAIKTKSCVTDFSEQGNGR